MSDKITARNRANAKKSTGPRTKKGKARSALNALKLGLTLTRHVVLPHEDPAAYEKLHADTLRAYPPESERERLAVEEIAHCRWAFRRFDKAEAFSLSFPATPHSKKQGNVPAQHKLDYIAVLSDRPGKPHSNWTGIHNLTRYRGHWQRRHQRALAEYNTAQQTRYREERMQMARERQQMQRERHEWARQRQFLAQERQEFARERQEFARERQQFARERHELAKARHAAHYYVRSQPDEPEFENTDLHYPDTDESGFVLSQDPKTRKTPPMPPENDRPLDPEPGSPGPEDLTR
jgi:hypothetical protein